MYFNFGFYLGKNNQIIYGIQLILYDNKKKITSTEYN